MISWPKFQATKILTGTTCQPACHRSPWVVALGWIALVNVGLAVPPSIESVTPLVIERGKSTELEIVGAGLDNCQGLVFYSEALQCESVSVKDDYTLIAKVQVKPDCPIANHAFRLLGADGFSDLKTVRVSRYPVIREAPRQSRESVMDLAQPNVCVWGILEDGDYDRYRIHLQRGQRFTAEVEAIRLGGTLLDTVLIIYDPQGQVVAFSDDGSLLRQDPSVTFVAGESGEYVVEVHETNYEGSSSSQYALYLGDFPAALVAFPAGGQVGTQVDLLFLSEDGQSDLTQTLVLPSQAAGFELFALDGERRSASPVPFRLSNFANVHESEPDSPEQARQAYTAPIAFNGILQSPGDIDFFALEAAAGEQLRLEVFADRIGSPLDSLLQVFNPEGRLVARNDDHGSQDSRIEFRVPATGVYRVAIGDKLQRGDRTAVYRIEVEMIEPELTAFLPRPNRTSQRQQTIAVPQGNRTLARVGVRRDHVPDGAVQLRFESLPAGMHASPVYIPENEFWALAILEADQDAPVSGGLANLVPTGRVGEQIVTGGFEQVVDLVAESADRLYHAAVVERVAAAVTSAMPFRVELEQPQAELAVGGTIDLRVRVERLNGFAAPILIEFPYLPDGCVGESHIVIEASETEGSYRISASPDAAVGDFHLAAVARVALAAGRERSSMSGSTGEADSRSVATDPSDLFALADRDVASQLIDLRVMASPVTGDFDVLAAEQGTTVHLACQLDLAGNVPVRWKCELEGLPNRVLSAPIECSSSEPRIEFEIDVPADVPAGAYQGIQCRLSGLLAGSFVSFVIPVDAEMRITEPGKLFRAADGRLLSPLEALRIQNGK